MPASKKPLEKLDLVALHKTEYVAKRKPILIETKPAQYLAIDGSGAPGGPEFEAKIGALYGMAFTIKMTWKFSGHQDYTVGKLESLWWAPTGQEFPPGKPEDWQWKLMIRIPEFITQTETAKAVEALAKKGKSPAAGQVKLETINEGRCVQMLHVGPYDREAETVAIMQSFAIAQGLRFAGKHHEIYLSDPRRVPPERLKTILREPVQA